MKYVRYLILALLGYALYTGLWHFLFPNVVSSSEHSVNAEIEASVISHYRSMLLPWIVTVGMIFVGWLFSRQRAISYSAMALAIVALVYAVFSEVRSVAYTLNQSLVSLSQGHGGALGNSLWIWSTLCLLTILALPFFMDRQSRLRKVL